MPVEELFEEIVEEIKRDEGYRGYQYDDHLGNPTIGYGTLLPLSEEEAEMILKTRLRIMVLELQMAKPFVDSLPLDSKIVLLNMVYQLGVPKLLGFRKMWAALERGDFLLASQEMLDSRWAKQTPNRANKLSKKMRTATYIA